MRADPPTIPVASEESLQRAAIAISQSSNPMILVGNGAIRNRASAAITDFATALNIPVTNTFMGKGVIDYRDERSLWTVGLQQRDYIACALDESDLIIAIGYDLIEYGPKKWNPQGNLPIVHIAVTPAEIDSSYIPTVEVIGDISDALNEIGKRIHRPQTSLDQPNQPPTISQPFAGLRAEMQRRLRTIRHRHWLPDQAPKAAVRPAPGARPRRHCDL